jgi:hypothetical protein
MQQEETTVRPYELRAQPTKTLLQRLYRDVSDLAKEEIELTKIEVHERAGILSVATRGFAFAAFCGVVGVGALATFAIAALAYVVTVWLAALIVAVVLLGVAFAAAKSSQRRLADVAAPLRSTIGTLVGPPTGKKTLAELRSQIEFTRRHLDETLSALENKTDLVAPVRDTAFGLGSLGVAVSAIVRTSPSP